MLLTRKNILIVAAFNFLGLLATISVASDPVLSVESGKISGSMLNKSTGLSCFKGIPYAAPPVGELRWKPPTTAKKWDGVRACTEFGPAAPQKPLTLKQNEDCLYLNIWTKKAGITNARLPVLVWIHGGGLNRGSGHRPFYDGTAFANRNTVLVTINYRLGALGFLAHPALSAESAKNISGNYGLMDQAFALQWVKKNIRQFGGDPDNVTIFGESAGGTSVSSLCVSPPCKGLFHKAIIQSPWMFGYIDKLAEPNIVPLRKKLANTKSAEELGSSWAKNLTDKKGKEAIAFLRSLPTKELLQAVSYYRTRVTVDDVFLSDHPGRLFESGHQHDIPIMIGTTKDEGVYFRDWLGLKDRQQFENRLADFYGEHMKPVAACYPGESPGELYVAGSDFVTDSWFVQPARQMLEGMSKVKSKSFQYEFARANHKNPKLGAPHAIELRYVFNTIQDSDQRPEDQSLADLVTDYWVQFAKTGNPNRKGFPRWPTYTSETREYLQLNHVTKVLSNLKKANCDVIDRALKAIYSK